MSQIKDSNLNSEHGKHVLHLKINEKNYEWNQEYITGAEVRKLGNIFATDEIFLAIKKPWEDELIMDDTIVNLARPEIEHFFSKEKFNLITIIVNGEPKEWNKRQINFKELIILTYGTYNDNPNFVYTIAFEDGPKENPEGSMIKGSTVYVVNKMIFHATATDKS